MGRHTDSLSRKSSIEFVTLSISQPQLIMEPEKLKLEVHQIKEQLQKGKAKEFRLKDDGTLTHFNQICVPRSEKQRKKIMSEAHRSMYIVHSRSTKMYKDLKMTYWWNNMKREIAKYVEPCPRASKLRQNTKGW
jgi:hypothetical protein